MRTSLRDDVQDGPNHDRFQKYLAGNEAIVETFRHHYIVVVKPLFIWLGTLFGTLVIVGLQRGGEGPIGNIAVILFLGVTVWALFQLADWWWWDTYVITNKRVMKLEGIFTRRVGTIPLGKITDTSYRRTALGRVLGYGDLVLDLPGQDTYLPVLNRLSRPDDFYHKIMSIAIGGGPPPPRTQPISPSPAPPRPRSEDDTGPLRVVE